MRFFLVFFYFFLFLCILIPFLLSVFSLYFMWINILLNLFLLSKFCFFFIFLTSKLSLSSLCTKKKHKIFLVHFSRVNLYILCTLNAMFDIFALIMVWCDVVWCCGVEWYKRYKNFMYWKNYIKKKQIDLYIPGYIKSYWFLTKRRKISKKVPKKNCTKKSED